MAKAISLTFDAKFESFVRAAVAAAQSVENVEKGVKRLTQEVGRAAKHIEFAGTATGKAFAGIGSIMSSVGGQVAAVGAGYLTLQTAIRVTTALLGAQAAQARTAADAFGELYQARLRLAQVAGPNEFPKLTSAVRAAIEAGGLSEGTATQLVAKMRAEAPELTMQAARVLGSAPGLTPESLGEAIGAARDTYGRQPGLLGAVVAASRVSGSPIEEVLEVAGKTLPSAKAGGVGIEEALAIYTAIRQQTSGKTAQGATASLFEGIQRIKGATTQERIARFMASRKGRDLAATTPVLGTADLFQFLPEVQAGFAQPEAAISDLELRSNRDPLVRGQGELNREQARLSEARIKRFGQQGIDARIGLARLERSAIEEGLPAAGILKARKAAEVQIEAGVEPRLAIETLTVALNELRSEMQRGRTTRQRPIYFDDGEGRYRFGRQQVIKERGPW